MRTVFVGCTRVDFARSCDDGGGKGIVWPRSAFAGLVHRVLEGVLIDDADGFNEKLQE